MPKRPTVFVGSSTEGIDRAKALQVLLDHDCEVELWSQGAFGLTHGTLESLVLALPRFDFAVLILTPDDLTISRSETVASPRDNVVFELGLFTGALGRDRTFMVYDRKAPLKLPSDLAGITAATYELHSSGNFQAALGAASTLIANAIARLGVRDVTHLRGLDNATAQVESVGSSMQRLITLLARSRRVELDIIVAQFGGLIERDKLQQVRQDLADLQLILDRS